MKTAATGMPARPFSFGRGGGIGVGVGRRGTGPRLWRLTRALTRACLGSGTDRDWSGRDRGADVAWSDGFFGWGSSILGRDGRERAFEPQESAHRGLCAGGGAGE